ncbi:PEP-CTERM sorting domain-containing protein [Rubritalea spongiae]|uniref:PEP-CTERM sorting domain-containing protein n=1 Tax=Rubritalea spongiae TaxID=430797 RepID=A0ABW5E453_9BACT
MKTSKFEIKSQAPWLAGALVATAGSSQAANVQITLTGNQVSNALGDTLDADVTGDGVDDMWERGFVSSTSTAMVFANLNINRHSGGSDFIILAANYDLPKGFGLKPSGFDISMGWLYSSAAGSIDRLIDIQFTDERINGGATTNAWLDVTVKNVSTTNHSVSLNRVVFDDAGTAAPDGIVAGGLAEEEWTTVPEPSSLAMLALGAGGLLVRRKREAAA